MKQGRLRFAWYASISLLIWTTLILRRGLGWRSVSESLWTEDSTIFLNQVFSLGIRTLWTPYQGYLHTFQRLFCLVAARFPLAAVPYLLCAGWCIAFLAFTYVLNDRLARRGVPVLWVTVALALVGLQPHGGEVYFSITNTQWVLGLTLAVYLALPEPDAESRLELAALAVVCLTGPFSLLLSPILLLQAARRRDLSTRWRTYAIVAAAALVQLSVLLSSDRLKTPVHTGDTFGSWVSAAWTFVSFGSRTKTSSWLSVLLWILTLGSLLRSLVTRRSGVSDFAYPFGAALLLFALSVYSVSLWSSVTSITPLGGGGRYFFVPYGLIFVGTVLLLANQRQGLERVLPWTYAALAFAICALSFKPDPREDLQWPAFARFGSVHRGVEIPINPQWNFFPTWKVIAPSPATERVSALTVPFRSQPGTSTVSFDLDGRCAGSRVIGVEAQAWREQPGYAVLSWGQGADVGRSSHRLRRFYPGGATMLQFAFTRDLADHMVTIEPSVGSAATVNAVRVYCL